MSEIGISRCPICGGAAAVQHMYDTYDRADYGWNCGCTRFRLYDDLHGLDENSPPVLFPRVYGCRTKQEAIEMWNEKAKRMTEVMQYGESGSYQHPPEMV